MAGAIVVKASLCLTMPIGHGSLMNTLSPYISNVSYAPPEAGATGSKSDEKNCCGAFVQSWRREGTTDLYREAQTEGVSHAGTKLGCGVQGGPRGR